MPSRPAFLNVDLVLRSGPDLGPLLPALAPDTFLLRNEGGHVVLELSGPAPGLEPTLAALCTLIERLPADAREVWTRCTSRVFDAGFDSALAHGDYGQVYEAGVSPGTLRRIADLDASLLVTLYPLVGEAPPPGGIRHRRRRRHRVARRRD